MTEKGRLLLFLIAGLVLSALVLSNGKLMLLAIPLLIYLMVGLLQAPTEVKLLARRTLSATSSSPHDEIDMRVRVENQGRALWNLRVSDQLMSGMSLSDSQTDQRLCLPSGGAADIAYNFRAERGVYTWTSILARANDPFELFVVGQAVPAAGDLLVRPRTMRVRRACFGPHATKLAAGSILARKAGPGTDYWGIREYRPGDSLRRLNWRKAARYPGSRFTNEFEREEITDFGLVVDTRRLSNADAIEEPLFESSVSAAASLGEAFLRNGNRVSLLLFGRTTSSVFPGFGKHQLDCMLRSLARARLGGYVPFDYLKHFPSRLFPTRSQLVVFSRLDRRDLAAYACLRAYGYDVLLISPDPVDFETRTLPLVGPASMALRAAKLERIAHLRRLMKMGVRIIDWEVDKPLDAAIQEAAGQGHPGRWARTDR